MIKNQYENMESQHQDCEQSEMQKTSLGWLKEHNINKENQSDSQF